MLHPSTRAAWQGSCGESFSQGPSAAGVFVTLLWTLLLRLNTWRLSQQLLFWNTPLMALFGTLWDWLENISLLMIVSAGTRPNPVVIDAALFFKRLKLTWLSLSGAVIGILILLLVINVMYRVIRHQTKAGRIEQRV